MHTVVAFAVFAVLLFHAHGQHLARTANPNEMIVSWQTTGAVTKPVAQYSLNQGNPPLTNVSATSHTYLTAAGYTHNALFTGLSPNTAYYYRVTSTPDLWTPWATFTTPNLTFTIPFQIPVYGDMGITHSSGTIAQLKLLSQADQAKALAAPIPFVLHVGDISYADDRASDSYEKVWNEWFSDMQSIHAHLPYMVLPGNHEHQSGKPVLSYSEYFVDFNYRFSMPLNSNTAPYYQNPHNMYWSFDHQNVHFIAISTETGFTGAEFDDNFGDILTWLKQDLEKAVANRAKVPWIVAMGHRPLYSSSNSDYVQKYLAPVQNAYEDLFHTYKVDLFFCGHVHAYERSWPMYKGKATAKNYQNPTGLVQVDAGGAGCIEGLSTSWLPLPDWSVVRYSESETYGLLTVKSNSELEWNLYRSSDNKVVDSFTLTQTRSQ